MFAYYRKLTRYYQMYGFEAIHSVGVFAHLLSISLKVRFNTPLIWQLYVLPRSQVMFHLFRYLAHVFSDILLTSQGVCIERLGRNPAWKGRLRGLEFGANNEQIQSIIPVLEKLYLTVMPEQEEELSKAA